MTGVLADGTGYVGEVGVFAVDEASDLVQCHVCGRWLRSVAAHLRTHGYSAEDYRAAFGLSRHHPLECPGRLAQRSTLGLARAAHDPVIRDAIAAAVVRARAGELGAASRAAAADPTRRGEPQREELRRLQREHSAQAGAAAAARATARRAERVRALGFDEVADYLAARIGAGYSLAGIAGELGIAREAVTVLVTGHGLPRPGEAAERDALARAGFADFGEYLTARHAAGGTVAGMARELGHSADWVRKRARRDGLTALTRPAPTGLARATAAAAAAGFGDVGDYLRYRYEHDPASATKLAGEFGMQPQQAARLLAAAGTPRRHDPETFTAQALAAAGYADLAKFAIARERAGATVTDMAAELGHSDTWLARRLRAAGLGHLIGPPGNRPDRRGAGASSAGRSSEL